MSAPQRPGEITYYEELGLDNTASADEIRDAFRAVARLLHPDQQSDPLLKETAEFQMRKLNRIYGVLSDAARRTAYDESLNAPRTGPIIVFSGSDGNLKKLLARGGAFAAIVFGTMLLIWFALTGTNTEVRGQDTRASGSAKAGDNVDDAGEQITRLREQLRAAETERNSALEQLGRLQRKQTDQPSVGRAQAAQEQQVAAVPAATALTELPLPSQPTPAAPGIAASANSPAVAASQFAGFWVLAKASGSASPGGKSQYPPEFIEVTITERNGSLHGQYHSRYQVLDHAISPDVDFTFNGTPSGGALSCTWQGSGGAKGRMTLKLLPASTIEVAWNATELGSQQWLVNGAATLTKK